MTPADILKDLFGDYRAEWPPQHFADHFVRPAYFAKLESARPCFLFGGRGTGKTTALRSLRFDAAHTRLSLDDPPGRTVENLPYIGLYLRMDKNQVLTFEGPDLQPREWGKLFTHYFNLLACREFCSLLCWVARQWPDLALPSADSIASLARSAALTSHPDSVDALLAALDNGLIDVELYANNPRRMQAPLMSAPHRPVRAFAEAVSSLPWGCDRLLFCCLDEYENLLTDQQSILNTYIKHSTAPLSYKVGVRSNGLTSRATLDGDDPLKTPDDYLEIEIADEGFELFAERVAELRLSRAADVDQRVPRALAEFLPSLTLDEEAELLGVRRVSERALLDLRAHADAELTAFVAAQTPLRIALLAYWRDAHPGMSLTGLADDWRAHPDAWATRYGNYAHSVLFWLSNGRKGAHIRKYYSGVSTLLAMSSGNIRYFMELVDRGIAHELSHTGFQRVPIAITPRSQTMAARLVGQKRLDQLEGVSVHGVRLKRLVLGIGRVFFERTRTAGTAPEQNAFTVTGSPDEAEQIVKLITDGIGHLAFESFSRSKRTSVNEPSDYEYRIHPIFSAMFEISHRKKRRIAFDAGALLELITNPGNGIHKLLGEAVAADDELPEQLGLFAAFFRPAVSDPPRGA